MERSLLFPGVDSTTAAVAGVAACASRRVLRAVGRFLEKATPEVSFEILGYHRLGIRKYEQIGRPYLLADMEAVSSEQLGQAKALLRAFNLTVV